MLLLATLATTFALAGSSGVAPCDKAMIGHGPADWRGESVAAGPVGVRRHPLSAMSPTRNGFVTKMPLLVEVKGEAPVRLNVFTEGHAKPLVLRLGKPRAYERRPPAYSSPRA